MPKTTLVKSITSLSEARYCSGMMVDYISFDLNPESADYVPKNEFEEIKNWLSGVKILGSFETFTADPTLTTARTPRLLKSAKLLT
jgi:phosphoribosylanthranilate isomerase